jgi:PKD domain-containing protein
MKKILLLNTFLFLLHFAFGQEVIKIQKGGGVTIQSGADLHLEGGITLDDGSSLLNNGTVFLKNNVLSNISNWTDNSVAGALSGTGIVIFNSTSAQQFTGPTQFYTVYINTDQLSLNNDLSISNLLRLIKGKINATNYVVALINSNASSLENDITNSGYANSWINGNLRRSIATNTSTYDFPVGNSDRSNLLQFINNNIAGPSNLTASFGPKPGSDAGLNVIENGNTYTAVNSGGVWKLVPNASATSGNYALHLYFNGFTDLTDNRFGILRRPDASANAADWIVPAGSLLEPLNGIGRKVSEGFAGRYNISDFSQLGIGEFSLPTPCEITGQSAVCIASANNIYAGPVGMTTYLWNVTGNAGIVGSSTNQTVNISTAGTAGTFTITLVTTLNGVAGQCSKTVTVNSTPTCSITGADELCFGIMNATYGGPANMLTYSWLATPGLTINGSTTSASVNVTASAPGLQTLTLNATGAAGCTSQCTKTINVRPIPPCSITGASNVTTGSTNNQYTGPLNLTLYDWSISGNGTIAGSSSESTVNVTAGAAGSFTLTLTTTLNGCTLTCSKTVAVDLATIYSCNITGTSEACNGSADVFTAPLNFTSYNWSITGNGTIMGSTTGSSVTVVATAGANYTITLQTMFNGVSCSSQKTVVVNECASACTYTQGFYGNTNGMACNNNSGAAMTPSQLMLNAFGATTSKVFGSTTTRRFFTLYQSDITNGNIYRMLPGGGNAGAIDVDNVLPFDGASYDQVNTWSLVPLQRNGPQIGRIRNSLLAQTITLWFNISNNSSLGALGLVDDTLLTRATATCGSNTPVGDTSNFGIPHNVIMCLNGGNGYPATVSGLFALANDVLGGLNTSISASDVANAVDAINNAFDGCRVLVRTIPYAQQVLTQAMRGESKEGPESNSLKVIAYPNPYKNQFQLHVTSPVTGIAKIEFYTVAGQKIYQMSKTLRRNSTSTIQYTGPLTFATLFYRVTIEKFSATGIVLKPN